VNVSTDTVQMLLSSTITFHTTGTTAAITTITTTITTATAINTTTTTITSTTTIRLLSCNDCYAGTVQMLLFPARYDKTSYAILTTSTTVKC